MSEIALARRFAFVLAALMLAGASPMSATRALAAEANAPGVNSGAKLYALDCGRIEFKDFGIFSDTGEYDGKSHALVDPCFLIVHPRGTLLWDTGIGDRLVGKQEGEGSDTFRMYVDKSLNPDDVRTLPTFPKYLD